MVSLGQLAASAVASFILIVFPGPSVLFAVGRALAHGSRTALVSVAGNAMGLEVVAVSVALGIGTLVQRSVPVFTLAKLAGAGYLIWLRIRGARWRVRIVLFADRAWPDRAIGRGRVNLARTGEATALRFHIPLEVIPCREKRAR